MIPRDVLTTLFRAPAWVQPGELTNEEINLAWAFLEQHNHFEEVGSSRVDLQACKLEYSIVSPK